MKRLILFIVVSLLCSTNYAQWVQVGVNGKSTRDICVHNNKLFAVTYADGVFESSDNGLTWIQHSFPIPYGSPMKIISVGTDLFVATLNQLFKSTNDGVTWTNIRDGAHYGMTANSQFLFLAVYGTGVYRSSDKGVTWEIKNEGLTNTSVASISSSGSKIVVGTSGGGLYISENNGESWTLKNNGLPTTVNVLPLLIDNTIWVRVNSAAGNFLYNSTNNGDNWSIINGIEGAYRYIFKKEANYLAGGENVNLMKSNDSGISLTNFHYGLTTIITYGCVELNSNLFLASSNGVWKRPTSDINLTVPNAPVANIASNVLSSGFTASWNSIAGVTNYYLDVSLNEQFTSLLSGYNSKDVGTATSLVITGLSPKTDYYYRLKAKNAAGFSNPSNVIKISTLLALPAVPVLNANNTFTQTSFKATWNSVGGVTKYYLDVSSLNNFSTFLSGYENKDVGNVTSFLVYGLQPNAPYHFRVRAYNEAGSTANSNVLSVTTRQNSQWIQTSGPSKTVGGPANTGVRYFIKVDNAIYGAAYSATGLFKTTDNGTTWVKVFDCANDVVNLLVDGNNIYATTNGSGVYISEDKGVTWNQKNSGLTNLKVYSITKSGANLYAGTDGEGVFLSINNGTSWSAINTGLTQKNINTVLTIGTTVFAGSSSAGVFVSTNFGVDWRQTTLTGKNIIILKTINNKIYAATWGGGIYISNDNGNTWNQSNTGLGTNLNCLIFSIHTANDLFTTTGDGIYYSKNGGATWTDITANFPSVTIWTVEAYGNYIFAGTSELGVFKRTLSEIITDIDVSSELPTEFKLYQNYPNPFNPSTIINYQLPTAGLVSLKVYDVLGKEVKTLVNEFKQAGTHNYQLRIENGELTSGIYFYRLTAGNFGSTKKLILIK